MKWFPRTCTKMVVIWLVVVALASVSYAAPPSDRCILVRVQVADRDDIQELANMGLDIWEYRQGGLTIRVTGDERNQIKEGGFAFETITEDVYQYTERIRQEQISLFADRTSTKYHSHDEVIAELVALEASGVAQTYIIGNTHEGRSIWAVKISDNPLEEEGEPGALFLGCHHAREWISVEVPLYVAQHLVNNYLVDPEIQHLVNNCEIWIVPVVNPDGYEYSRTTDRLWRKNRRNNGNGTFGVDLNRNYDYMWGLAGGSSANTNREDYRGPSAFSEPESQAVRDLVLSHDFQVLMSYHNYGQMTCTPWDYTWNPCPDDPPMYAMAFRMRELIRETSGATYIPWDEWPGRYLCSGTTGDWSYGTLGIYSFLIELRPATTSFVLPENQIRPTCDENLPVALYLTALSAANSGITNLDTGRTYGSLQLAVNDADDGTEIVLDPGVYHESVYFLGKRVTLRSQDPNNPDVVAATVIDGYHYGPAVTTSGVGDTPCVLAGLTIVGQTSGVCCCDAAPTIRNCTITAKGPSAVDFWEGHAPVLADCNIPGPITELYPGLLAYWKLDESEGMGVADSAGDNNAYALGNPVWQPDGGQVGGALLLDGVDDFISAPAVLNPAKGPFSVFAWIKGGLPGQVIISQTGGANWLMADAEGKLRTELQGLGRLGGPLQSQTIITDGQWHRIALVWDGSRRTLCVDGVVAAEDTQSALPSSTNGLYIGTDKVMEPGTFFSGLIDDIRIYSRAVQP